MQSVQTVLPIMVSVQSMRKAMLMTHLIRFQVQIPGVYFLQTALHRQALVLLVLKLQTVVQQGL